MKLVAGFDRGLVRRLIQLGCVHFLGRPDLLGDILQIMINMTADCLVLGLLDVALQDLRSLKSQVVAMAARACAHEGGDAA